MHVVFKNQQEQFGMQKFKGTSQEITEPFVLFLSA
jgi:hypothetical protein